MSLRASRATDQGEKSLAEMPVLVEMFLGTQVPSKETINDEDVGVGVFPESKKRSLWQAHAFEQVDVAWIGVKRFKILFGLYIFHARRPLRVALFQPLEGMIAISL
jgi:hypothetical protein